MVIKWVVTIAFTILSFDVKLKGIFECLWLSGYYNTTSEKCINGKKEKIQPGTTLCGGVQVDDRLGCCGLQAYNKTTEQCCEGIYNIHVNLKK